MSGGGRAAVALVVAATAAAACGSGGGGARSPAAVPAPPARATTSGDALLALLPAGADAVAELDVARLRANPAVGDVVAALRKRASGFDPLGAVDVAVAAVYRLGAPDAATIFILRGPGVAGLPESVRAGGELLDEHTLLVGPSADRARVRAGGPSVAADARFLALRAQAMPAKASGSIVRITARLGREARIAAAGRLGVDELPATVSAWGDVADDAAIVALLGGDDAADAARLAALVQGAEARIGRALPAWLPRGRRGGELTTQTVGRTAKIVWLLGPRHLAAWARDAARRLQEGS